MQNCGISNCIKKLYLNLITNIDNSEIPSDLFVGWDKIEDYTSNDQAFIDEQFLAQQPNQKRKNEHYSSRKLFAELLIEMDVQPEQVTLKKHELGKPYAEVGKETVFTSFSHSDDWVVCALSRKYDIGVDCEPLSRDINPRVFDRILGDSERLLLGDVSPLAIWTMKEAVVKCLGMGIRTSLQKFQLQKKEGNYSVNTEQGMIAEHPFICDSHQLAIAWKEA